MKFDQACFLAKELGRRAALRTCAVRCSLTVSIIHVPHSAAASTDTEIFPSPSFSLSQMIITITTLVAMIQPLSPSPVTANNSSDLVITRGGIPPRSPALSPLPFLLSSLSPLGLPT